MSSSAPRIGSGRRLWIGVAAATAFGLALRAWHLTGYAGLQDDEAYTLGLAQRGVTQMLHLFTLEANGLPYALVEWPLVRIDDGLATLRLPAFVAGVVAIPALFWAGRRLASPGAALLACVLLALNPLAVVYSQLARPYAFAMLFGILSFGCLARAVDSDSARWWVLYVAATALAGYSNAFSLVLLVPAQAVLGAQNRRLARRWLIALVGCALCLVPLAVLLGVERSKRNALYWIHPPTLQTLKATAVDYAGGTQAVLLIICGLAVAGLIVSRRLDIRLAAVCAWAFSPLLLFLLGLVTPAFELGYSLAALPGAMLLIGTCVTRLPVRAAQVAGVGLALLLFVSTVRHARAYHSAGVQLAVAALDDAAPSTPVVFDIPEGLPAAGFYARRFAAPDGHVVVSEWGDEPIPPAVVLRDDPGGYGHAPAGPPDPLLLSRLARRTGSVYVLVSNTSEQGSIDDSPGIRWARKACRLEVQQFGYPPQILELFHLSHCAAP